MTNSDYDIKGFITGRLPPSITKRFMTYLSVASHRGADFFEARKEFFSPLAHLEASHESRIDSQKGVDKYKLYNEAYDFNTERGISILTSILHCIDLPLQQAFGSFWKCANIRIWKTIPNKFDFGPQKIHCDNFPRDPRYITKVMIYMTPPSLTRGTTQLLEVLEPPLFPAGPLPTKLYPVDAPVRTTVEGQAGTWILFDNNLPHIGVAPTTAYRVVCEVTVETMKKEVFDLYPIFGGFGAQYEN